MRGNSRMPTLAPVSATSPADIQQLFSPTITQAGNTFSTQSGTVMRVAGGLLMSGQFRAVSTITATLTISLPAGFVAQTNGGAANGAGFLSNTAGTGVVPLVVGSGGTVVTANGPPASTFACTAGTDYAYFIFVAGSGGGA